MTPAGFPHSEISGSKAVCASPKLIAACRVLHRFPEPRHPPCALSCLTSISRFPRKNHPRVARGNAAGTFDLFPVHRNPSRKHHLPKSTAPRLHASAGLTACAHRACGPAALLPMSLVKDPSAGPQTHRPCGSTGPSGPSAPPASPMRPASAEPMGQFRSLQVAWLGCQRKPRCLLGIYTRPAASATRINSPVCTAVTGTPLAAAISGS